MERFTFQILRSRSFLWPALIVSLAVAGILVRFASIRDRVIFPDLKTYRSHFFTDAPVGGTSQILAHSVSDSLLLFTFRLGDGFHSPYAGLSFSPVEPGTIDARVYNRLSIQVAGANLDRIGVSIFTRSLGEATASAPEEVLFHSYLNISSRRETYRIPIGHFQHPDWWEDLHHIPQNNKGSPDLSQILHVNIGSAFSPSWGTDKTMAIHSIAFTRCNRALYTWLGVIYLAVISLLFGAHLLARLWRSRRAMITVLYQPIGIEGAPGTERKCIEYINTHYHISNLTLGAIARVTGTNPRRITQIIKTRFRCNFKTYLNRIRINESKRLLSQTDLNVGEIAFRVGFNSQSHFNRVFKNEFNLSPSEYRVTTHDP